MLRDALERRAFFASICFVLGLSTVFVSLGATASAVGQALGAYKHILMQVGGVLIVLFALHFLGVFRISLFYREARIHASGGGGAYLGAYGMGLAFGFGWTPCIGPILGTILFFASQEETIARGVTLLAVYSMGLGLPFILAALAIHPFLNFMRRFRRHLGKVEKAMGLLLLLVGVSFLTGGFNDLSFWMLETFPVLAEVEGLVGSGGTEIGVATAFAGGLLSFLSPCVLPMAPPYLAFLAGTTLDQWTQEDPSASTREEAGAA